ncbi:MAG: hypothetical protein L6264_12925 [Weeksellaceae bacterium]|nr:hypothetical protein [Bacteroidota bacterium]MCG2781841.1 hypothetical protein [Weeksellaceae bacterium]
MKNYFTILLLAIFGFTVFSCTDRNDTVAGDGDTYPMMKDITGSFNSSNNFTVSQGIAIASTDVVLVYRQSGTDNGNPIWQQIPRTLFLNEGELDYDFDFTKSDVLIKAGGTINFATQTPAFVNSYLNNQRFRIVLVPASQGKNANLDYSDYQSVIRYYNIPDRN